MIIIVVVVVRRRTATRRKSRRKKKQIKITPYVFVITFTNGQQYIGFALREKKKT